jgi:hypothetical protein
MKLNKKQLFRGTGHVYTDDDYKWYGRKRNYLVTLRRKTDEITEFWFYISDTDRDSSKEVLFNSSDNGTKYPTFEECLAAAEAWIDNITKNSIR